MPLADLIWCGTNIIHFPRTTGRFGKASSRTAQTDGMQLLKDMEQDPKVCEDLERIWSNGQITVLKKALSAAAELGTGLLEATEVVEPNPISPNENTSYSNLYHCDRDGVYLYIDTVSAQLADAIGKSEEQA